MHPFERILSVTKEDIELTPCGSDDLNWAEFWLNPRRLQGSDLLMPGRRVFGMNGV